MSIAWDSFVTFAYPHAVGDWAQTLVDIEVSDEAAPRMGRRPESWLIERGIVAAIRKRWHRGK